MHVFIVNFKQNDNNHHDNDNGKSVKRIGCKHCNRCKPKTIIFYHVGNTNRRLEGLLNFFHF